MSKFTVVIPVYGVETYLDQCVESVVSQTFRDFEIILVDDGSPDCCPAMCDAWAEKDSRIRVIHQRNGGLSAARNAGIQNATGEYVMFLDSDDWWVDSQVLETVFQNLQKTGADVLSFNYRKIYNGVIEPPYFPQEQCSSETAQSISEMLYKDLWVTGACNKAVRRELLREHALYFRTGITSEDIDWTLRVALYGRSFAFENVCVFLYRQHAASISHSLTPEKVQCLCENVLECVRLLEVAPKENAEPLKPFVAYQYGTLLYNVVNLPVSQRSSTLMATVKKMKWLLDYSNNAKVRMLRLSSRICGLPGTMVMLRLWQKLLKLRGRGV